MLDCIWAIDARMGSNRLKMNPDKTQMIWLSTRQQLASLHVTPIRLHVGTTVVPSTSVHNLSVLFDNEMSMMAHVNSITSSCFFHLWQLLFIRRSLTPDAARTLIHAFISCRVNYSNTLLYGATSHVIHRLQAVLNAAARLITGVTPTKHITPVLRDVLHWLPVRQRIEYKIALLVFKCLHGIGPAYLSEWCTSLSATNAHHQLRSISHSDLHQPRTRTHCYGPRSFRSSSPSVWNSLPPALRGYSLSLSQFKADLKRYLYLVAYNRT